jgi:hypothetical protein
MASPAASTIVQRQLFHAPKATTATAMTSRTDSGSAKDG